MGFKIDGDGAEADVRDNRTGAVDCWAESVAVAGAKKKGEKAEEGDGDKDVRGFVFTFTRFRLVLDDDVGAFDIDVPGDVDVEVEPAIGFVSAPAPGRGGAIVLEDVVLGTLSVNNVTLRSTVDIFASKAFFVVLLLGSLSDWTG